MVRRRVRATLQRRRQATAGRDWKSDGLYVVGVAGIAYEMLAEHVDRPYLLAVFAGMVGLPSFLGKDDPPDPPDGAPSANGSGPSA